MEIGFTGSRHGMQKAACAKIQALFMIYWAIWPAGGDNTLHHGDCVGSDEQAFNIAKFLGFASIAYPASDVRNRWLASTASDIIRDAAPALERNKTIVSDSDILIAAVHGFNPGRMQERSGTWATIRYAKKEGLPIWLVDPWGQAQFIPAPAHRDLLGISSINWGA